MDFSKKEIQLPGRNKNMLAVPSNVLAQHSCVTA
jgi:hypothetical protein